MDYSDKQFRSMQEEAMHRVMEMRRRSRDMVEPPPEPSHENEAPEKTEPPRSKLFDLSGIKLDEDKVMIGLLIYILYKQGADTKLLLALGYLLL